MPERKFTQESGYRYGFNGKENDNEVKGEGNQQDYGMRIYDTRLGRFLSEDPITKKYPELTPYQFASNRPIDGIDLDGLEYLDSKLSIITISIQLFQFNGQTAISGSVFLSASKNVTASTYGYLRYWDGKGKGNVATFRSPNYEQLILERYKAVAEALRRDPSIEDATADAITQPEVYTEVVPKNKKEQRAQQKSKNFWTPSGVAKGQAKGNAILAAIELTTFAIQYLQSKDVDNDFQKAKKQLDAVINTVTDIQFGLDNNIFAPADLENINDYANYLLDGTKPQITIKAGQTNSGEIIYKNIDDNRKIKKFDEISNKISKKKREKAQQTNNTSQSDN